MGQCRLCFTLVTCQVMAKKVAAIMLAVPTSQYGRLQSLCKPLMLNLILTRKQSPNERLMANCPPAFLVDPQFLPQIASKCESIVMLVIRGWGGLDASCN